MIMNISKILMKWSMKKYIYDDDYYETIDNRSLLGYTYKSDPAPTAISVSVFSHFRRHMLNVSQYIVPRDTIRIAWRCHAPVLLRASRTACATHSGTRARAHCGRTVEQPASARTLFSPIHRPLTIYSALLKAIQLSLCWQKLAVPLPPSISHPLLPLEPLLPAHKIIMLI